MRLQALARESRSRLAVVVLAFGPVVGPVMGPAAGAVAKPAAGPVAVIRAFDRHPIVLLGEVHWNRQQHLFIQQLLNDPRFPASVDDIAVEFGNSLYQPLIDRYVSGENVPADSLSLVWRNTTQPLAWDMPIYADVYKTIRAVNSRLPDAKRLRVIALDPPIEWQTVNRLSDFPRIWGYRDPVWFQTLDREALSKGRKVLVIAGGLHILRFDPPDFVPKSFDRVGLGDALAQRYGSATYRIYPATGNSALARELRGRPAGSLIEIAGTKFGSRSSQILWPSGVTMFRTVNGKTEPFTLAHKDYPPIARLVDAILVYGSDTMSAPLPVAQYGDSGYVAELRRRNSILRQVFGLDQSQLIDSLASQAKGRTTGAVTGEYCVRYAARATRRDSHRARDCHWAASAAFMASGLRPIAD